MISEGACVVVAAPSRPRRWTNRSLSASRVGQVASMPHDASTPQACTSTKPGDFAYKACAPFCKTHSHCEWCKCRKCSLCGSGGMTSLEAPPPPRAALSGSPASSSESREPANATKTLLQERSSSTAQQLIHVRAALKTSEAKNRGLAERVEGLEAQLALCRKSSATLRSAKGIRNPPPPPGHGRPSSAAPSSCSEAIRWAQQVGIVNYPSLYPGLNVSSPPAAFQSHLHRNDPASHCPSVGPVRMVGETASEGLASALLLLGVVLCALCNAYSLGYVQPSRFVRRMLGAVGCPQPTLIR